MRRKESKVEFGYHLRFWSQIDENSRKTYETRKGESIFPLSVPRFLKKRYFLDGYRASHVCPSARNSLLVKMSVEQRWNDTWVLISP
jgi:hypothetical protein